MVSPGWSSFASAKAWPADFPARFGGEPVAAPEVQPVEGGLHAKSGSEHESAGGLVGAGMSRVTCTPMPLWTSATPGRARTRSARAFGRV